MKSIDDYPVYHILQKTMNEDGSRANNKPIITHISDVTPYEDDGLDPLVLDAVPGRDDGVAGDDRAGAEVHLLVRACHQDWDDIAGNIKCRTSLINSYYLKVTHSL